MTNVVIGVIVFAILAAIAVIGYRAASSSAYGRRIPGAIDLPGSERTVPEQGDRRRT